jgi:hypothetical protein
LLIKPAPEKKRCDTLFPLAVGKSKEVGECYYGPVTAVKPKTPCTWENCSSTTTFEIPNCKLSKAQFVTTNTKHLNQNVLD